VIWMSLREDALYLHGLNRGKLEVRSKIKISDNRLLSLVYSPGVAEPCKVIHSDESKVYQYTSKGNMVAVISDGTSVLGLGDIGPKAAIPVMEGKALLLREFAGVDAFPICLDTRDEDEIVETAVRLAPVFGGINLEDISAPRCFVIEERLKNILDIPVFHDDQHGTAVVVYAGLLNALKLVNKELRNIKIVINGAGAAGIAVAKLLLNEGARNIILCDSVGLIYPGRGIGMNPAKEELANFTNPDRLKGGLEEAIRGADVFIGVSVARVLTDEMVRSMNKDAIVFALANPDPEILPPEAFTAGAAIVATGRSDYPNQVNNILGFPGIFRGALDAGATCINEEMKIAAAYAIASIIDENELSRDYIIPSPFDRRVVQRVAKAVAEAAEKTRVTGNTEKDSKGL
jgi:malate dehydrogenase (oxaloacetate-decarboxylating)